MLYDEDSNIYIRRKEFNNNLLAKNCLINVKEYGEYITSNMNIKSFSRFEFKGYVIMLILDGAGIVRINQQVIPLSTSDLLIFNGDSPQVISNNQWKVCYVLLDGENIHKIMTALFKGQNLYQLSHIDHFYELFHSIYKSVDTNLCASLNSCSYVLQLLSDIVKYEKQVENIDLFETKVLGYIEKCYMEDISIDDLATYCGYSRYYFIREFKKRFKDTPYNYLKSKRISYAKQLLTIGELSIEEIGKIVGFHSFSNFCVAFKNNENMTPKEYQNQRKGMRKNRHERIYAVIDTG